MRVGHPIDHSDVDMLSWLYRGTIDGRYLADVQKVIARRRSEQQQVLIDPRAGT